MQTTNQVYAKIDELMANLTTDVLAYVERFLSAGAVTLDNTDDDFLLPKVLYAEALRRVAEGYRPLSKEGKAIAKNLNRF